MDASQLSALEALGTSPRRQLKNSLWVDAAALVFLVYILLPYSTPILLAAVMAFAVQPLMSRVKFAPALLFSGLMLIFALSFSLIVFFLYAKIYELAQDQLSDVNITAALFHIKRTSVHYLNHFLREHSITFDTSAYLEQGISKAVQYVTSLVSSLFYSLPKILMSCFVFAFFLFLFLRYSRAIKYRILNSRLLPRREVQHHIHILQTSSYAAVIASVILGGVHAVIIAGGTLLLHVGHAGLIFVVSFIFAFIPVLGASFIAVVLAVVTYFTAGTGTALGFLGVALISSISDNLLRPFIVRDEASRVPPLLMLVIIFSSLEIFGFAGLFISPVVANFALAEFRYRLLNDKKKKKKSKLTSRLHHAENH